MGWGGWCINVLTTTSLILSNLEDALDATLMTWGGVGWGGVLTS